MNYFMPYFMIELFFYYSEICNYNVLNKSLQLVK